MNSRVRRWRFRQHACIPWILLHILQLPLFGSLSREATAATVATTAWNPQDDHPCNIRRISLAQLHDESGPRGLPPLYGYPLVIRAPTERNAGIRALTARDVITQQFPADFNVTLSSSNALSERRRTIPLQGYLDELAATPETTHDRLANESWYLFGETYTEPWQDLLRSYVLPPCRTCQRHKSALSFGLGNRGSGVQWHTHGPGFSEAFHGRKHWILYPPHHRPDRMHKDQSSRQWMQDVYTTVVRQDDELYECTLEPGDLLYFPDQWWHATINLDPYTAFLSTFTTEHGVEETDEL